MSMTHPSAQRSKVLGALWWCGLVFRSDCLRPASPAVVVLRTVVQKLHLHGGVRMATDKRERPRYGITGLSLGSGVEVGVSHGYG